MRFILFVSVFLASIGPADTLPVDSLSLASQPRALLKRKCKRPATQPIIDNSVYIPQVQQDTLPEASETASYIYDSEPTSQVEAQATSTSACSAEATSSTTTVYNAYGPSVTTYTTTTTLTASSTSVPTTSAVPDVCPVDSGYSSKWQCIAADGTLISDSVSINWGHSASDAAWACNQWKSDCKQGCTASPIQKFDCMASGSKLGDVEIYWGFADGDATWACNQWKPECANNACTASKVSCNRSSLSNDTLAPGLQLTSLTGIYTAKMQTDGNFVIYHGSNAIWSLTNLNVEYSQGSKAVMQNDGNFVIVKSDGSTLWSSGTSGISGPAKLVMQDDGNLVLYDSSNASKWSSGTYGQ